MPPTLIDLAPGLPAEEAVGLLGITFEDIKRELEYRWAKKRERALQEMAAAAKVSGERKFLREGGTAAGEVEMMIHPASYHYWGQRLGYECWDDPQFRREYRRDNAAARVKSTSDRLTIVRPELDSAPNTRAALSPLRRGVHGRRGRWAA